MQPVSESQVIAELICSQYKLKIEDINITMVGDVVDLIGYDEAVRHLLSIYHTKAEQILFEARKLRLTSMQTSDFVDADGLRIVYGRIYTYCGVTRAFTTKNVFNFDTTLWSVYKFKEPVRYY